MKRVAANLSVLIAEISNEHHLNCMRDKTQTQFLIRGFWRDLSNIIWSTNGESIQIFNNRLLCTFFSADDAVKAATTMHQFSYTCPSNAVFGDQGIDLQIRIGTGIVVREGNQLRGEAVTFARQLKARGGVYQTLISEATRNYLSKGYADQTRYVGKLPINGNNNQVPVFEYIASGEDETLSTEFPSETAQSPSLDLILGATVLTVSEHTPICTIGRQAGNAIIMKYPRVSRKHAIIEKRQGKFILKDSSFNGTFVKIGNLDTVCLKNDEIQLIGTGIIFPGRKATPSSPGAIHYHQR